MQIIMSTLSTFPKIIKSKQEKLLEAFSIGLLIIIHDPIKLFNRLGHEVYYHTSNPTNGGDRTSTRA